MEISTEIAQGKVPVAILVLVGELDASTLRRSSLKPNPVMLREAVHF